jgi:hypothetical protein
MQIITGSRSANAFGGNTGGGITYCLVESYAKPYAEVRYHYASYNKVSTEVLPLTFGIRW